MVRFSVSVFEEVFMTSRKMSVVLGVLVSVACLAMGTVATTTAATPTTEFQVYVAWDEAQSAGQTAANVWNGPPTLSEKIDSAVANYNDAEESYSDACEAVELLPPESEAYETCQCLLYSCDYYQLSPAHSSLDIAYSNAQYGCTNSGQAQVSMICGQDFWDLAHENEEEHPELVDGYRQSAVSSFNEAKERYSNVVWNAWTFAEAYGVNDCILYWPSQQHPKSNLDHYWSGVTNLPTSSFEAGSFTLVHEAPAFFITHSNVIASHELACSEPVEDVEWRGNLYLEARLLRCPPAGGRLAMT